MSTAFYADLAREAASRYPPGDRFARSFARGKLSRDPAFRFLLERGLVRPGARILDLGAGQGLLAALFDTAAARGDWPAAWPAAPRGVRVHGIELARRDVERAHAARLDGIAQGDIRTAAFEESDVCVMLDVLHYLDPAAQASVLSRARDALSAGGILVLRVADRARGWRFGVTIAADRLGMMLRGSLFGRYHCRSVAAWREQLAALGFAVEAVPMSAGTPFANVLLVARYDRCVTRHS